MSCRFVVVAAAAVTLLACERSVDVTGPARAARGASFAKAGTTKTNIQIPFNGAFPNPCNGDLVTLSGTEHFVLTTDASGSLFIHINFEDLKGVGLPSGARYQLNAAAKQSLDIAVTGTTTETHTNEEMIGQGSTPNLIAHITQIITFDTNGLTVENTHFSAECHQP